MKKNSDVVWYKDQLRRASLLCRRAEIAYELTGNFQEYQKSQQKAADIAKLTRTEKP